MIDIDENQKFESLKFHLEQQTQNLRNMTQIDLTIMSGYMTLQIALGGWLVRPAQGIAAPFGVRIGLSITDLALAIVATWLLLNSRLRRGEVIQTIHNLNEALGYDEVGFYLPDRKINADTKTRFWCPLYLFLVFVAAVGLQLIILMA
jgi:hypothetical protein